METDSKAKNNEAISPASDLAKEIEKATGINAMECYQCGKCSAGCPIAEVTDVLPHDFWRMVQLGMTDQLLNTHHMWLCVGCETCTTRCPNKLPLPQVIDYLRQKAAKSNVEPSEPNIVAFHKAFMDTVEKYGRSHELGMIQKYKFATGDLFKDFKLGLSMFSKGKIKIFAKGVAAKSEIRELFEGKNK